MAAAPARAERCRITTASDWRGPSSERECGIGAALAHVILTAGREYTMRYQQLRTAGAPSYVLVFDTGDEVSQTLLEWVRSHDLVGASFTGIGAFRDVTLGYFDIVRRDYERIVIDEQVEVLSLAGNIARVNDDPKVHAHVVVGKRDGTAHGGHLLSAHVRPTLELVVVETSTAMQRTHDPATGLPLLNPGA